MATPTDAFSMAKMVELLRHRKEPPRQSLMLSSGYRDRLVAESPVREASTYPNPIYTGSLSYGTIPVRVVEIPKVPVYDWAGCRSPSRAKRRHAKGIPQRVKITMQDVAYLFDDRALSYLNSRYDGLVSKMLWDGIAP